MNIEDISQLTDSQLFSTMKKCGLNVGPITGTTRSLYERKLRNFLDGKGNITINASTVEADENKPVQKEPAPVLSKSSISLTKKTAAAPEAPEPLMKAPSSIPVREKSRERPRPQTTQIVSQMAEPKNDVLRDTINRVSHTEEVKSSVVMTERPAPVYTKPAPVPVTTYVRSEETVRQEKVVTSNQIPLSKPVQPSTTTLAYAASTITTTSMMPERTHMATEKPKLPQPSFSSSTSAFGADLGNAFTNPLRNYDSPSLFRDKDRDIERFDNFLSGTKSSGFATSTLRRNEPIPTPVKDKFAERLNNYGLLKSDPNDPTIPAQTPLRNRVVNPADKTPIRNDTYQTKQPTPAKSSTTVKSEDKSKQAQQGKHQQAHISPVSLQLTYLPPFISFSFASQLQISHHRCRGHHRHLPDCHSVSIEPS